MTSGRKTLNLLDQEKLALAADYAAAHTAHDRAAQTRLEGTLDTLYWRYVEEILTLRVQAGGESLSFTEQERLLLDMGLLDECFVPDAAPGLSARLLTELNQQGAVNHFYLSEWLQDRYQRYRTNLSLTESSDTPSEEFDSKFQLSRRKILEKLTHLLGGLQGVTPEAAQALMSGRLDVQIITMGANLLSNRLRRDFGVRHRLWELRRQMLTRARARTSDPRELKFFDVLDNLYQMEWRTVYDEVRNGAPMTAEERREHKNRERQAQEEKQQRRIALKYLLAELHFARSLFPLGALAGGILRSCAVLTSDAPRVTKADTAQMLKDAVICDRNFIATPVVLIAPFKGRGIYEWDRDSLVIGLNPAQSPADSASNAAANYTMLIDSLQKGGKLKKEYKKRFTKSNYQKDFQADYRVWMCEVGHGNTEKMSQEKLDFFRQMVGLDLTGSPAASLAPVEIRFLTPQARHIIRAQLRRQTASAKDSSAARWRLGLLSWMDGDLDEGLREVTHAAKLVPDDVQFLIGVGLMLSQAGRTKQAQQILQICCKRGKRSIWGLYATDALNQLAPATN